MRGRSAGPLPDSRGAALSRLLLAGLALALAALAFAPILDRAVARRRARRAVLEAGEELRAARLARRSPRPLRCLELEGSELLRVRPDRPRLCSWGNIGGCGVGGGASSSTGGGAKWIGRSVTGGHVDIQCITSESFAKGGYFTTINTRVGTWLFQKWGLAVNVPILYKVDDVTVFGVDKQAGIAGFGDVSLELNRKLGITNAHLLSLIVSAPSGSYDAVRQGVVLPQILQLGSGVVSATGQFEHTFDRDWGMLLVGGSATYAGWENSIGDYRASSVSAYGYGGYLLGPFVPSVGVTLLGKFGHDRQRQLALDDALFVGIVNAALEWSIDWLAVLLSTSTAVSYQGFEGFTVSLGVATSVF